MLFIRRAACCDQTDATSGASTENSIVKALAREVDEVEALGLRNMAWKHGGDSALAPAVLDLDWLIRQPELPFLVPLIPASTLHRSLRAHGLEDALEVIECIRGPQLVRVLDHDIWARNENALVEDISTSKVVEWLRCWLDIGRPFLAERLSELEEETFTLLVSQLLDVQPEGIGRPNPEHADDYWTTPDGRFHLRVRENDPEVFEIVKQSVDALYEADMKYASSVLSYTAMLVRSECLESAERWRKGRLADEGFVERDEALAALRPRRGNDFRSEISKAVAREKARQEFREKAGGKLLDGSSAHLGGIWEEDLPDLIAGTRKALLSLDAPSALNAMQRALGDEQINLLLGPTVRNPEVLLDDEELVTEATEALVSRGLRMIWAGDMASARRFSEHRLLVERVFARMAEGDAAGASDLKARLTRVLNTFVSATAPQTDSDALARALSVVRGSLNVGLETVLASPGEFGLTFEEEGALERGSKVLALVGPEFLFHLGWTTLCDVALRCARVLDACLPLSKPALALEHLLDAQRFVEIRRWLGKVESDLPQEVHHVVASFLNRVPLYPEVLSVREPARKATRDRRAFETLADVASAREFLENFPKLSLE